VFVQEIVLNGTMEYKLELKPDEQGSSCSRYQFIFAEVSCNHCPFIKHMQTQVLDLGYLVAIVTQ